MEHKPRGEMIESITVIIVVFFWIIITVFFLLNVFPSRPIIAILSLISIYIIGDRFLAHITRYRKTIIFSKAKVISKKVYHGKGGYMCCIIFVFSNQKKLTLQTSKYDVYNPIRVGDVLNLEYQGWWIISTKKIPDDGTQPLTTSKAKLISKFSKKAVAGHMFYCASFQTKPKEIRELNLTQKQFESVIVGDIVELEYQGNSVRAIKKHKLKT